MMTDGHRYPSKEELDKIRKWKDVFGEGAKKLIDYIEDLWWYSDEGVERKGKTLKLHTLGWSGNEDIIDALRQSYFWLLYWEKTERGGHYTFKLRDM